MVVKKCPSCGEGISHSWYVFGGTRGRYRCVHCSVLLKKNKWHALFGGLAGVLTYWFFDSLGKYIGSDPIAIILILIALYIVALLLPIKWVLLPLSSEDSHNKSLNTDADDAGVR